MATFAEGLYRPSKRASAHISKFNYHLSHTVPELIQEKSSVKGSFLQTKKGLRNTTFHFLEHSTEGVAMLDSEAILTSALKIYVGPECLKLSGNSYRKSKTVKTPYLPIFGQFDEIVEFCIVNQNEESTPKFISKLVKSETSKLKDDNESGLKLQSKKLLPSNYELYVVHHCQHEGEQQMPWENVRCLWYSSSRNTIFANNSKMES